MSTYVFLSNELQALSAEAKRKNVDVRDAAEKALSALKTSPADAIAELRNMTSTSQQPVLLAPIVLGCATKNQKVISLAVASLQRLVGIKDVIPEAAVPTILNTLRTVLSQGVEIQLKILQTLVALLTNCKNIHGEMMAETLLLSFKLQDSKIGVVSSTAAATLRQLVMFVFEALVEEDRGVGKGLDIARTGYTVTITRAKSPIAIETTDDNQNSETIDLRPSAKDAYLVFKDLCLLVSGDPPTFLKLQSLPRTFGLELVESVLSDFWSLFKIHPELLHILRTQLSPYLITSISHLNPSEKPQFSITLRLMRVIFLLLKKFNDELVMESECFLSSFIRILGAGEATDSKASSSTTTSAAWLRILALEIFRGLCTDFDLLRKIWVRYDAPKRNADKGKAPTSSIPSVFMSMLTAFNRLATERSQLLGSGNALILGAPILADAPTAPAANSAQSGTGTSTDYSVTGMLGMAAQAAGVQTTGDAELAIATAAMKVQCIDQLDKAEAPSIPDTYAYLLTLQCLLAVADGFSNAVQQYKQYRIQNGQHTDQRLQGIIDMTDSGWPALLAALSYYMSVNLDDQLFETTLRAYQEFTTACGILRLATPRNAFLTGLCKYAVPPSIVSSIVSSSENVKTAAGSSQVVLSVDALGLAVGLGSNSAASHMYLSKRNLAAMHALIAVANALAAILEKEWFHVFEALQNVDYVVKAEVSRRLKKKSLAVPSVMSPIKTSSPSLHSNAPSTPVSTTTRAPANETDEQKAHEAINELFRSTANFGDDAFQWFTSALCRLNGEMIGMQVDEHGHRIPNAEELMSPGSSRQSIDDASKRRPLGITLIRMLKSGERSYALSKLGDVATYNLRRLLTAGVEGSWDAIVDHLLSVQHWTSWSASIRTQAAEVLDELLLAVPRDNDILLSDQARKRVQQQIAVALAKQAEPPVHASTLDKVSGSATDIEIRRMALDTLYKLLENHGHDIVEDWRGIFSILATACPPARSSASILPRSAFLVRTSFPSLQLVCTDFLGSLKASDLRICIDTLAEFVKQNEDVNIALTAGGLLWQVSDHLQSMRKADDRTYLDLWTHLLQHLLQSADDSRQEVRDGVLQTLCRTIEQYGGLLDVATWDHLVSAIIFPLLSSIDSRLQAAEALHPEAATTQTPLLPSQLPLPIKQWDDTKILALSSISSICSQYLSTTLVQSSLFADTWLRLLRHYQQSFLTGRSSVATTSGQSFEKLAGVLDQPTIPRAASHTFWTVIIDVIQTLQKQSKQTYSQSCLESLVQALKVVYNTCQLGWDLERCSKLQELAMILLKYNDSPEYRLDQDTPTLLQSTVIELISSIKQSDPHIAALTIKAFATMAALPYSIDKSSQPKRPTFVGVAKVVMPILVTTIQDNQTNQAIFVDQAVHLALSNLAIPMQLKHKCPAPSRFGDDQPLWRTATECFLSIARITVSSIKDLSLSADTTRSLWSTLIDALNASISADSSNELAEMDFQQQEEEENFDQQLLLMLRDDIIHSLGNSTATRASIKSLASTLATQSMLHELSFQDTTESRTIPAAFARTRLKFGVSGSTADSIAVTRERFAFWCFDALFSMCKSTEQSQHRVIVDSLPYLMERCASCIEPYLADAQLRGKMPFERIREEEMLYVLQQLADLKLPVGAYAESLKASDLKLTDTHRMVQQLDTAHLFRFYSALVQLLSLERPTYYTETDEVVDAVRNLMTMLGQSVIA